jgi:hypothetical protein
MMNGMSTMVHLFLLENQKELKMKSKEIKLKIIEAGHRAVEQLIKVAKEAIIKHDPEDDLSADRLKNAAATKKLAIFDAFEILNRIEAEKEAIDSLEKGVNKTDTKQGFAERRSK